MSSFPKIFIDGSHGTTGLELSKRLESVSGITLLKVPYELRKNDGAKEKIYSEADLVVLCLPDQESVRATVLIDRIRKKLGSNSLKVLDTSTQFRIHPEWVYGHPQIWPEKIRTAVQVANPGCYAIGFVSLVYPLIKEGWISPSVTMTVFGVSGYSGGGKKMIEDYQKDSTVPPVRPYALDLEHKHIAEMMQVCRLKRPPLFLPMVGSYYRGMLVMIALPAKSIKKGAVDKAESTSKSLNKLYRKFYSGDPTISVMKIKETELEQEKFLSPLVHHDRLDILIAGRSNGDVILIARLDNLGKGASGNAMENIRLMLSLEN